MRRFRDRREEYGEENPDDESEGRGRQQKLLRNKDFKDLNPKDKKARKEPKKPWGKKERFLVLFTILVTAGLSAFLYFSNQTIQTPKIPNIKLPEVSLPKAFGEEVIFYEN